MQPEEVDVNRYFWETYELPKHSAVVTAILLFAGVPIYGLTDYTKVMFWFCVMTAAYLVATKFFRPSQQKSVLVYFWLAMFFSAALLVPNNQRQFVHHLYEVVLGLTIVYVAVSAYKQLNGGKFW